jgi:DNA-binding MurR/RpiR family transcriptional regulator
MTNTVATATDSYNERLAERGEELAPAERRVAQFLVDLGPDATLLSAAALAKQLGTSDATVVRTAKSLGYSGLAEMRRALAAHNDSPPLRERLRRTLDQAPGDQLLTSAIRNHVAALETLTRNVSTQAFQDAVSILASGDRVVWRGVGPSAALANYGQLLAQRVGKPSSALVHTGTSFADELLSLEPNDAIVVFAYGRLQTHVHVLLEHAKNLDLPVVLITDTLARRLADSVDVTLQCGRGTPGLFASHATTLVVVEALILAIAATDQTKSEASLARLNELRASLAGRRIDVDTP